ncbi:MAG: glycosyltransferase [Myxococcales bacterium]|nr:glycosyltransferase [Myxococcales bacterium]
MISAVVPARNEQETVGSVVRRLLDSKLVSEVIVVDNASDDHTAEQASEAGARVLQCLDVGLGCAMKVGMSAAREDLVLRTDADIRDWQTEWVDLLRTGPKHALKRGIFHSPYDTFPVTNLVVRPFFQLYRPEWDTIPLPLSGTYLFNRCDFALVDLPNNWAIDIAILTHALDTRGYIVDHVNIGLLADAERSIEHYIPMAKDINEYLTFFFRKEIRHRLSRNMYKC